MHLPFQETVLSHLKRFIVRKVKRYTEKTKNQGGAVV